jgi:hypothetical protein
MMSDQIQQQIQQANQYIQNGQRDQARSLLESVVKTDPNNAEAWWLLAMVAASPVQMQNALENVVRIEPGRADAKEMLDKLNAQTRAGTASSTRSTPEDPFAAPGSAPASGAATRPPSGSQIGESVDDLFTTPAAGTAMGAGSAQPAYTPPPYVPPPPGTQSKRNPLLYIIVGLLIATVCICGGCFVITGGSIAAIFSNPTVQAIVNTGITLIQAPDRLPGDVNDQGTINANQQQSASLAVLQPHAWKYNGKKGEQITVTANSSDLQLYLGVYDSSGRLLKRTDFGQNGHNPTLTVTLPDDSMYSIFVGANGGSTGSYTITVKSTGSQ